MTDKKDAPAAREPESPPASAASSPAPKSAGKNWVRTAPYPGTILAGEGFPDVTPGGVAMTNAQRDAALAAADQTGVVLLVEERDS